MNDKRVTITDQNIRVLAACILRMIEGKEFTKKQKRWIEELATVGYITIKKDDEDNE